MSTSKLREVARRAAAAQEDAQEHCDLCGEPIPPEHRHLLDTRSRELMCACRACKVLFDRGAAGGNHYLLVPERRLLLRDFEMDDAHWDALRVPVEMAFFFHHGEAGRVLAFYPSPAGPTESLLELDAWEEIERANPVLETLEPDVEALLVNRARGARDHYLVPIDDCYRLVGLIRMHWRGLSGGSEVWSEIETFFAGLGTQASDETREREEATWP